jgi:hypothetical protein
MKTRFKVLLPTVQGAVRTLVTYDDGEVRLQGLDRNGDSLVTVCFVGPPVVRIADEGVRLRLLEHLGGTRATILIDERSELTPWVFNEGLQTRDMSSLRHFILLLGEEVVDILAFDEPTVHLS